MSARTDDVKIVTDFYEAFRRRDGAAMAACYSEDVAFSDPVFQDLRGRQAKSMWRMLCHNAKELHIAFQTPEIQQGAGRQPGDGQLVTTRWTATYLFHQHPSRPGRRVINQVVATMVIADGKIVHHTDKFSFWRWSAQAFGWFGAVLGWLPAFKQKVRSTARGNLERFVQAD